MNRRTKGVLPLSIGKHKAMQVQILRHATHFKKDSGKPMNTHHYRITLEYLGGKHAGPELHAPLSFHADNHDDLFEIIQRVQQADMFDADTSAALALGMKLFSEVMLKHRHDPLFAPILSAYRDYIDAFKQRVSQGREAEDGSGTG